MSTLFYVSYVALWLLLLTIGVLVLLLYRHFGVMSLGTLEGVQRDGLPIGSVAEADAVAWARASGVVSTDEQMLDPLPWPSRAAWCHARCNATEARLEALARSLLDGLSVWGREIVRPANEQSPGIIRHEQDRARRLLDAWEREIAHPLMGGALNLIQLTLACALGLEARNPGFIWRPAHPALAVWFDRIAAVPSLAATAPPAA